MPELPEVETVVRGLRSRIIGQSFGRVIHQSALIRSANVPLWEERLPGCVIESVRRRGKYIILNLGGGQAVVVHLRMTGRLWIKDSGYIADPHDRFIVELDSGQRLVLADTRQFAQVVWHDEGRLGGNDGLNRLGPDALAVSAAEFVVLCRLARRPIKSFLLDQTRIAGLGNIYADESLFESGIRPDRRAASLRRDRVQRLHRSIQLVLRRAIRSCGTTIDTFSDPEGRAGGFGPRLKVYGRTGAPCKRCQTGIRRIVIAGRGTHFCPRCQR